MNNKDKLKAGLAALAYSGMGARTAVVLPEHAARKEEEKMNKAYAKFAQQRGAQRIKDRDEALVGMDPEKWIVFSLRWGMLPPGGLDDWQKVLALMHAMRYMIKTTPPAERQESADWLEEKGYPLPAKDAHTDPQ